jgi:hypothetical protein
LLRGRGAHGTERGVDAPSRVEGGRVHVERADVVERARPAVAGSAAPASALPAHRVLTPGGLLARKAAESSFEHHAARRRFLLVTRR